MYIGVDVGGTNLVAGLVDRDLNLLATAKTPSGAGRPPEEIVSDMVRIAREAAGDAWGAVTRMGLGIPGKTDSGRGEIVFTPNLPFRNLPIGRMIRQEWDIPVFLENDAGCAALGEYYAGAARGRRHVVALTIGTGIGGGIITDGRLYRGAGGSNAEPGHMVIVQGGAPCGCGRRGCWEAYASAGGLKAETVRQMERHRESRMWALTGGSVAAVSGHTAFEAAAAGDMAGRRAVDTYVRYLATGLVNLINAYCPELVCIGGGVAGADDALLLTPLRELVAAECFAGSCPEIVRAALGNDAGIIGAAIAGLERGDIQCAPAQ